MKNVKWMIAVVSVVFAVTVPFAAAVTYDYSWEGNEDPFGATPNWENPVASGSFGYTQNGDGTGTIWTGDAGSSNRYEMSSEDAGMGGKAWNPTDPNISVIEFRMKVDSSFGDEATWFSFVTPDSNDTSDDTEYWTLKFDTDKVLTQTGDAIVMDTTVYNTYQIVVDVHSGLSHLFINGGTLAVTWPGDNYFTGRLYMAVHDWSGSVGGYATWDYIRWTNDSDETFTLCSYAVTGDNNGDCTVDFADFAIVADKWLLDCNENPGDPGCN